MYDEYVLGDFTVSTDPGKLDVAVIHRYLSQGLTGRSKFRGNSSKNLSGILLTLGYIANTNKSVMLA